jgi:cobalt/nickel transport system permease protein
VDARAKVIAAVVLLVGAGATPSLVALAALAAAALGLAAVTRLDVPSYARRVWLVAPLFSAAVAAPALFAAFTPGEPLAFHGPLAITRPGALAAARLVLRVGASVSVVLLLTRTTGAPALLKALRAVGVPQTFVLVAGMTYRFLFLLAREVEDMHLGLLSRRLAPLPAGGARAFVTSRMAVLLAKSRRTAEDVHLAMTARGFRGEWRTLDAARFGRCEAVVLAAAFGAAALILLAPRAGLP